MREALCKLMTCMHAGAVLCAKALQSLKADKEAARRENWLSENVLDGDVGQVPGELYDPRWPEGQPDTYRLAASEDGGYEVRMCAGSPIGEVAFMSGHLQRTVRDFYLPIYVHHAAFLVTSLFCLHGLLLYFTFPAARSVPKQRTNAESLGVFLGDDKNM